MTRYLLLVLCLFAGHAVAQTLDARTLGTGGTELGRPTANLRRTNPAAYAAPSLEPVGERAYPLPIGLLNADFPSIDPDDDDFDLVALTDFLWNIPWNLQFGRPDSPSGDVTLGIAYDAVTIDLQDARELVPRDGFTAGGRTSLLSFGRTYDLGQRYGTVHVDLFDLYAIDDVDLELDDSLVRVLRDVEPIVGGRSYGLRGRGILQTGFTTGIVYAREIPLGEGSIDATADDWLDQYWDAEARRPRLWAGVGVRRYFGVAVVDLDTRVDLTGRDPLLGDDGSFTTGLASQLRQASPDGFGGWGSAWGVDLGAILRWRTWEFGAGVSDLFAEMTWSKGRVQHYDYDPELDTVIDRVVLEDGEIETPIPTTWRADVSVRPDARRLIGASLINGAGDTTFHLGAEEWVRPWFALRAGTERDERGLWQFGGGFGVRFARVGFDVGARSHARNLRGDRVGEIGLSLVLGAQPRGGI